MDSLNILYPKKGRLHQTLCYISGQMDHIPGGGIDWRKWITPQIQQLGIGVLDPTDKPTLLGREDPEIRAKIFAYKQEENWGAVKGLMKEVVGVDLRMVDICHFLIVYMDYDHHACGTYHEMFLGVMQRKPILFVSKQGKKMISNWLFGVIPEEHMFGSFEEMLSYLKKIDSGEIEDVHNRWRFFDFNRIYGVKNELPNM